MKLLQTTIKDIPVEVHTDKAAIVTSGIFIFYTNPKATFSCKCIPCEECPIYNNCRSEVVHGLTFFEEIFPDQYIQLQKDYPEHFI